MGKRLLQAFAVEEPDRFAQLLSSSHDLEEAVEVLNGIPDGSEGEVLTHLKPDAAERLLNGLPDELLATWLGNCPADVGRRLIGRLGPDRSEQIIQKINNASKRRALRRLTAFPAGSIGSLMRGQAMAISEAMPASEVETLLSEHHLASQCPLIVLGADDRVMGVLDLVAFIGNQDPHAPSGDFYSPVKAVHAESPLDSLAGRDVWQGCAALPVVDHHQKLVGYITRSQVEEALGSASGGSIFLDSAIELSSRYLQFLAFVMTLIISRRTEP